MSTLLVPHDLYLAEEECRAFLQCRKSGVDTRDSVGDPIGEEDWLFFVLLRLGDQREREVGSAGELEGVRAGLARPSPGRLVGWLVTV